MFEYYFGTLGLKLLDVQPGDNILELGPGTGRSLLRTANRLKNGKITGIDSSYGMIRQIKRKLLSRPNLQDRVVIKEDNFVSASFPNVDKIMMSFTFELLSIEDMNLVLKKCRACLNSGGKMVIVSLYRTAKTNFLTRLYEILHKRYPEMMNCRPIPLDRIITNSGWKLGKHRMLSMWGLPVMILEIF